MSTSEIPSLCERYRDYFPIGAGVRLDDLEQRRHLLVKHFNSITAGGEMKFKPTHPSEYEYTFDAADQLAEFARSNGFLMRGHTLIWHEGPPSWVFEDKTGAKAPRELVLERMREHIHTVVGRYKDVVYCWDVVNEAVGHEKDRLLRESPWLDAVGDDFVKKAFEFAHEADPNALLFYNDYSAIVPERREKICQLLTGLLDEGVPVHGMGMQGHWDLDVRTDDIKAAIERYASLGLDVQITELDISLYPQHVKAEFPPADASSFERQTEVYGKIFEVFRSYKDSITGVTFWGVADDRTWLDYYPVRGRKNYPLLFDVNHQPKEAFWRVVNS